MAHHRTVILGAGAAGLFCAAHAGGGTLVLDHARRPAEKVRISGGGRCNFTNLGVSAANFISENPHFAKSALARFGPWDFIDRLDRAGIGWTEKEEGQLFCDGRATALVEMLLADAGAAGARVETGVSVGAVRHDGTRFRIETGRGEETADCLVLATGGKSIPKIGATGKAYEVAAGFG
ncbi:MAG: aminoacetone oxidase family FAD-binding enzyme, partial [Alphaproteobacteria bacterium]